MARKSKRFGGSLALPEGLSAVGGSAGASPSRAPVWRDLQSDDRSGSKIRPLEDVVLFLFLQAGEENAAVEANLEVILGKIEQQVEQSARLLRR